MVIKLDDIFLKNSINFNYFVIINIPGGRTDPSFSDDYISFNQGYVVISFVKFCVHPHVGYSFRKQDFFFLIIHVIDVHIHHFYYFAINSSWRRPRPCNCKNLHYHYPRICHVWFSKWALWLWRRRFLIYFHYFAYIYLPLTEIEDLQINLNSL